MCVAIAAFALGWQPAFGSFHFMQIEQVVAGVNGDPKAQAIQLRMRSNSQNFVNGARLLAADANGENAVVLADFDTDVTNGVRGMRVLAVSAKMTVYTAPAVTPDFLLTNTIPEAYLTSGTLLFENDDGTLLVWRLSWGGAAYLGPAGGALTNDDDGDFGPPYPGPLPRTSLQALLFRGSDDAKSSNNAADYVLTAGAAILTNNAGETFTVTALQCPDDPDFDTDADAVCGDVDNCPVLANPDQLDADGDGVGNACDGCPNDLAKTEPGLCGCGLEDADDDDSDGVVDCVDVCPGLADPDQLDSDQDGAGDACDECPDNPEIVNAGLEGCEPGDSTGGDPPDDEPTDGTDPDGEPADPDGQPANGDGDGEVGGGPTAPQPRACGVGFIVPLMVWVILAGLFRYAGPGRVRPA